MTARLRGANVAGSDAFLLSTFMRRYDVEGYMQRLAVTTMDRRQLGSFRDLVDTIHAASADHKACADASAQAGPAQAAGESSHDEQEWITIPAAAALISRSPARLRQIRVGELEWRQVGRVYEVTRSSVLIYAETRRRAAA